MRTLLLLFILLPAAAFASIDTLTFRQIYNFNVGDTFDYELHVENVPIFGMHKTVYERRIVTAKSTSLNGDTLIYQYNGSEVDTITNLDSLAIFRDPIDTFCSIFYGFDTISYSGFTSNRVEKLCFESDTLINYTENLGRTYYYMGYSDQATNYIASERLVYYSNGITSVGTPYYFLDGSTLIKYMPLPEECALWTYTVGPLQNPYDAIIQQLRTGNKFIQNGRAYVELLYRCLDNVNNTYTPDSLLGYFYNDSVARIAVFVPSIGSITGQTIYSCNALNGQQCSASGNFSIDTILVGNEYRTKWNCNSNFNDCVDNSSIAGIGKLSGLVKVRSYPWGPCYSSLPFSLRCFSICGEILYPNDTLANCALISSINDLGNDFTAPVIFPTVADNHVTIGLSNTDYTSYQLIGIDGRIISSDNLVLGTNTINTSPLSNGIYLIQLSGNNSKPYVRKLVVKH